MLGSSRTRPINILLSRFRLASPGSYLHLAEMVTSVIPPPLLDTCEIVPRNAMLQDTRSQSERWARADAGDLQARLDLILLHVIKDQLSRCFRVA
jgi:hypothetical protein